MTHRIIILGLAWASLAEGAMAQQAPAPQPAPIPQATTAAGNAYSLGLLYTGEGWAVPQSGQQRGVTGIEAFDARFSVDTGKAFGWTGGTFVAEGFYTSGSKLYNTMVNAVDWQSPLETGVNTALFRLYSLYYDQDFGKTDVRFGIYDLETEFAHTKPMSLFLSKNLTWNTALDNAGTAPGNGWVGLQDYPYAPLALRIRQDFGNGISAQFAVADGVPDNPHNAAGNGVFFGKQYGAFFIGEADYQPSKYTQFMAGAWELTAQLPLYGQLNPDGSQRMTWGEYGGYIGGTERLYSAGPRQGLDGFVMFGASSPLSNMVAESVNFGLTYSGPFERLNDKVGVSMNVNLATANWRVYQAQIGAPINEFEFSVEATYRAKINEYLTVQPDIQYIVQPAYSRTDRNALLLAVHLEIGRGFEW